MIPNDSLTPQGLSKTSACSPGLPWWTPSKSASQSQDGVVLHRGNLYKDLCTRVLQSLEAESRPSSSSALTSFTQRNKKSGIKLGESSLLTPSSCEGTHRLLSPKSVKRIQSDWETRCKESAHTSRTTSEGQCSHRGTIPTTFHVLDRAMEDMHRQETARLHPQSLKEQLRQEIKRKNEMHPWNLQWQPKEEAAEGTTSRINPGRAVYPYGLYLTSREVSRENPYFGDSESDESRCGRVVCEYLPDLIYLSRKRLLELHQNLCRSVWDAVMGVSVLSGAAGPSMANFLPPFPSRNYERSRTRSPSPESEEEGKKKKASFYYVNGEKVKICTSSDASSRSSSSKSSSSSSDVSSFLESNTSSAALGAFSSAPLSSFTSSAPPTAMYYSNGNLFFRSICEGVWDVLSETVSIPDFDKMLTRLNGSCMAASDDGGSRITTTQQSFETISPHPPSASSRRRGRRVRGEHLPNLVITFPLRDTPKLYGSVCDGVWDVLSQLSPEEEWQRLQMCGSEEVLEDKGAVPLLHLDESCAFSADHLPPLVQWMPADSEDCPPPAVPHTARPKASGEMVPLGGYHLHPVMPRSLHSILGIPQKRADAIRQVRQTYGHCTFHLLRQWAIQSNEAKVLNAPKRGCYPERGWKEKQRYQTFLSRPLNNPGESRPMVFDGPLSPKEGAPSFEGSLSRVSSLAAPMLSAAWLEKEHSPRLPAELVYQNYWCTGDDMGISPMTFISPSMSIRRRTASCLRELEMSYTCASVLFRDECVDREQLIWEEIFESLKLFPWPMNLCKRAELLEALEKCKRSSLLGESTTDGEVLSDQKKKLQEKEKEAAILEQKSLHWSLLQHPAMIWGQFYLGTVEASERRHVVEKKEEQEWRLLQKEYRYEHRLLTIGTLALEKIIRKWIIKWRGKRILQEKQREKIVFKEAQVRQELYQLDESIVARYNCFKDCIVYMETAYRRKLNLLQLRTFYMFGTVSIRLLEQTERFPLMFGGIMRTTRFCGRVDATPSMFRCLHLHEQQKRDILAKEEVMERTLLPLKALQVTNSQILEVSARQRIEEEERRSRAELEYQLQQLIVHYHNRDVEIYRAVSFECEILRVLKGLAVEEVDPFF